MFFKRKRSIQSKQAILIQKKIFNCHDDANEIRNLYKMKLGTFHLNTSKSSNHKVYYSQFMTKEGKLFLYVDNTTYYSIKIDSIGILTKKKGCIYIF